MSDQITPITVTQAQDFEALLNGMADAFDTERTVRMTGAEVSRALREVGERLVTQAEFEEQRKEIAGL